MQLVLAIAKQSMEEEKKSTNRIGLAEIHNRTYYFALFQIQNAFEQYYFELNTYIIRIIRGKDNNYYYYYGILYV